MQSNNDAWIFRQAVGKLQIDRIVPLSLPLLQDYSLFAEEFKKSGGIWVMKPSGAAEGRGIFLFTKLSAVQAWAKPHLARRMKRSVHQSVCSIPCSMML